MRKPLIILIFVCITNTLAAQDIPKVFVLTDINLVGGDPDDRQSLVHLLWYADELDILGIVPDYWNGKGYEACLIGLEAYKEDFDTYGFKEKNFPDPEIIKARILQTEEGAIEKLYQLINTSEESIYVLVWGGMITLRNALLKYPDMVPKLKVLTIGTNLKYGPKDEVAGKECDVVNWNGKGRNEIFNDPRFDNLWWLESNWTYNGMFEGEGPKEMFKKLAVYGAMGGQIKSVTKGHDWAQYFRVGDTPSVTYLIDPDHDINDPESSSWAGLFKKPFPHARPNYYTDDNGSIEWDYAEPCNTWHNMKKMYAYNKNTLVAERQDMYDKLIEKLNYLYSR